MSFKLIILVEYFIIFGYLVNMNPIDVSIVSYLVQEITGIKDGSDVTFLLWQNGSVHSTIPATPTSLRGSETFKNIKHLPPKPRFNGEMQIDRQGGDVKSWKFVEKN